MVAHRRAAEFSAEYYCKCESAESLETLSSLLFEAAEALGLSYVACGAHIDPDDPPAGAFLFANYPQEWRDRFRACGYHRIDPVYRYAAQTRRAFFWDDDDFLAALNDRQKRLLNEARQYRVASGFTVPLRHDVLLPASISVISDTGDIDDWVRIAVGLIGTHVYQAASMLVSDGTPANPEAKLSRRERQCLELKAHGASDDDIAARLDISISTVCRHLDQAKLRLGAKSREHAIWRAVETRQIAP